MTTKTNFNKKDYMATYNKSAVAKQAQKNWFQSPEGKAKHRAALKNYHFKYCCMVVGTLQCNVFLTISTYQHHTD